MNIEEAKKKVEKYSFYPQDPKNNVIDIKTVLDIIDKIERDLQKPEIPQFVADWIEKHKEERWWLGAALADRENEKFREWLVICDMDTRITNQDVFARAWLDGFEIE
ncbi:DUF1642 domain-containing protein [Streptococcus canis]|uniref:DUF1642 domain-containing protein n=1 Tax=Streptococcus canis TaxID=1329 RepID=UPI002948CB81|nr:DUF1642 domain-containing protein [Streptococcus canis]MDV6023356.1 DUF1642 domain-containing protein [Streptococcus canis]